MSMPQESYGQSPGYYGSRPYSDPQQRRYQRPRTPEQRRAERDYIVPKDDPYLMPQARINPRQQYCRQLEERLARDWIEKNRGTDELPAIEDEMRKLRRTVRKLEIRAERRNCYEYFLFSKSVRRTRRCIAMDRKIQSTRRKLSSLEARHQRIAQSRQGGNYQRNELISALARNGCGRQYQQAARKNSWSFFDFLQPEDTRIDRRGRLERNHLPFATYRTMCVRLCDGFYYPVSFSAMSSKFAQDENACQSKCAAPAKLFVHENPGGSVETMTSTDGIAYSELPNAWRYRKEFIKGCSCKVADYSPAAIADHEKAISSGKEPASSAMVAPNVGNHARRLTPAKPPEKKPEKPPEKAGDKKPGKPDVQAKVQPAPIAPKPKLAQQSGTRKK